jgi:hypothetical protein
MHFCTAYVRIAGDRDQTVFRDHYSPISWPEVELLRSIHGDESVHEVKPFVRIDQSPRAERERLVLRYGKEPVDACFPGRGGNIETEAPEATIISGVTWKNPLTQLEEIVEGESAPAAPWEGKVRSAKGTFVKSAESTL